MKATQSVKCGGDSANLLEFLLIKTTPVILKMKPSVLLRLTNIKKIPEHQHYDQFSNQQQEIMATLQTDYMILRNTGRDLQVLFFDYNELQGVLKQNEIRIFLAERGYHDQTTTEEYLAELKNRFNTTSFPHEIGVFLGYPLKDVRGFIENRHNALPIPRVRWQVFGEPTESLRRMWMYRFAEDIGRVAIEQYHSVEAGLEQIRKIIYNKQIAGSNNI